MGLRVPNNFELVLRSLLQQATWSGPLEIKMSRYLLSSSLCSILTTRIALASLLENDDAIVPSTHALHWLYYWRTLLQMYPHHMHCIGSTT